MVYAFILHTVGNKDVQILYYKIYTSYGSARFDVSEELPDDVGLEATQEHLNKNNSKQNDELSSKVLFESISEKKELINYVSNKVHMHYSLKMKQTLIPLTSVETDSKITGLFKERHWKNTFGEEFTVVWQGLRGFGFALLCKKNENIYQAQNILDIFINQLEKQIKLLSDPLVAVKLVETVALIINIITFLADS